MKWLTTAAGIWYNLETSDMAVGFRSGHVRLNKEDENGYRETEKKKRTAGLYE